MSEVSSENTFGDDIEDFADKEAKLAAEAALKPKSETPIRDTVVSIRKPPESSGIRLNIDKKELHKRVGKLNIHTAKDPKSKKVKFHTVAVYIITELAQFDEEWLNCSFEIAAQESLNDGSEDTIEGLEVRMSEINGAVDTLLIMGRHFGVPMSFMLGYIPNINAAEIDEATGAGIDATIARGMR